MQTFTSSTTEGITDRQRGFILRLLNEIDGSQPDLNAEAMEMYDGLSKREASKAIDGLIERRDRVRASRPAQPAAKVERQDREVPEGRYALAGEATDGEVEFYQVRYGKSGKWEGFLFLDAFVGSPTDGRGIPVRKRQQPELYRRVLADIAADVTEAAARFGREIRHCGFCMSPLTDDRSRAAGYGETCAGNHGLPYPKASEVQGWASRQAA
jgi:hypothetical protein